MLCVRTTICQRIRSKVLYNTLVYVIRHFIVLACIVLVVAPLGRPRWPWRPPSRLVPLLISAVFSLIETFQRCYLLPVKEELGLLRLYFWRMVSDLLRCGPTGVPLAERPSLRFHSATWGGRLSSVAEAL